MSNTINNKKPIILTVMAVISFIVAGISIFLSQDIFNAVAVRERQNSGVSLIIFAVAIVVLLILTVFLRSLTVYDNAKARKNTLGVGLSLLRIVLFAVFTIAIACVFSLISGLLAMVLYGLFKNVMTFNTIKGILDAIITIIFLIITPLLVSSFWEVMCRNGGFLNVLDISGKSGRKKYFKILLTLLVLSAVGFLLSTAFNYAADSILIKILKTIIFGTTGTIGMYVTYSICGKD